VQQTLSDHCFGLLPFFGYRFAPRMRDLRPLRTKPSLLAA
jgi:hypothetical protein